MTTTPQEALREKLEEAKEAIDSGLPYTANAAIDEALAALSQQAAQEPQPDEWTQAQTICDLPDVDEAIRGLLEDRTGDNATMVVRAVMRASAAAPAKPAQISRAALNEFIDKVCLGNSQLIACAESAFYAFNLSLAGGDKPAEQEKAQPCRNCGGDGMDGEPWVCAMCNGTGQQAPSTAAQKLEKNAARYEWLRNPNNDVALVIDKQTEWIPPDDAVPGVGGYWCYEYRAGEELDAAIDAAIAHKGAQGEKA